MKEVEVQELDSLIPKQHFSLKHRHWVGHPVHLASTCMHHAVMVRMHTGADASYYLSTVGLMVSSQDLVVKTDPRMQQHNNPDGVASLGIFQPFLLVKPNISSHFIFWF